MDNKIRLQKMIAHKSVHSRRKAEELISEGKVLLNGEVVREMGIKVDESDEIVVDGVVLYEQEKEYYVVNKPINYISSRSDNFNRRIVTDLVPSSTKVYPVGRLDYNTSGLLILTNDGELANGLMHPKFKIPKTYMVKVRGDYSKNDLARLARGVMVDGKMTAPAKVRPISYDNKTQLGRVQITIFEGRNLQVRKMFGAIDCKVKELKRIEYAFLTLHDLPTGAYRELKAKEIKQLFNLIDNKE